KQFRETGRAVGLRVFPLLTDGTQPIGRGIGPALEARDALGVLQGDPEAPTELRERGILLAGYLLERSGAAPAGAGQAQAREILRDGRAWRKFQALCRAQGGMREPPTAMYRRPVTGNRAGRVVRIDNRRLGRVAKLAGAPQDPAAGLVLHARVAPSRRAEEPIRQSRPRTRARWPASSPRSWVSSRPGRRSRKSRLIGCCGPRGN
ncbi:MAG TPA: hypothetical protein VJU17_01500, partial [Gemmatimonadales bacterium]|nr:hypothetical protein [Gemmatimonadales bacterium]